MRVAAVLLAFALVGCATSAPINAPLTATQTQARGRAAAGEDIIILALSGGGARAASFHYGVLQGLRETHGRDGRPLSQHIALISSVSGGSVLAAYYALHGDDGLDGFDAAYLARTWPVRRQGSPLGWVGLARGGMNGPAQLADWLDANVYGGARMGALGAGPRVVINATDLYNATPFAFTPLYFDGICSDLSRVRVADAVAASMAAPVAFRPLLAQSFPDACAGAEWTARVLSDRSQPESARAAARAFQNYRGDTRAAQRYLHLSDGGVADNLGTSSLLLMRTAEPLPSPLTARETVAARRIVVLVVNAEYVRPRSFQTAATDAIGAYEMMYSPVDAATDAAKRAAVDMFRASLPAFQRDLVQFRCGLDHRAVEELGQGRRSWACADVSISMDVITFRDMDAADYDALFDTATDVSLPRATVDALIAGGRSVIARNAAVQALARN